MVPQNVGRLAADTMALSFIVTIKRRLLALQIYPNISRPKRLIYAKISTDIAHISIYDQSWSVQAVYMQCVGHKHSIYDAKASKSFRCI